MNVSGMEDGFKWNGDELIIYVDPESMVRHIGPLPGEITCFIDSDRVQMMRDKSPNGKCSDVFVFNGKDVYISTHSIIHAGGDLQLLVKEIGRNDN